MKSLVITGNYEECKQETPKSWAKDKGGHIVAEKIAKILAEYPENRWCEITRRAVKIGLGYLKGGA